ncbi:hypothetical protein KY285_000838 [Solanum tuberosum]|nr:hypothetical protein KY289_001019 [Solanum tuberosum]KAH0764967.1 hypothetical protein KY285_000838 [Solanum tuberosum]
MATASAYLIQDQNIRASLVGKNGISKKRGGGIGGRKALSDISKPSALQASKKNNSSNNQNCVKAQRKAMDMSCFLKEVGLDYDDVPVHLGASPHALELSMKSKPESPTKHYVQVEELPELIFYDQVCCISFSPCAASPKSVKPRYISWPDDGVLDFALLWNTYPFKVLMDTTFNSRITRSPLKYIRCSHCSVDGEDIKFSIMVSLFQWIQKRRSGPSSGSL